MSGGVQSTAQTMLKSITVLWLTEKSRDIGVRPSFEIRLFQMLILSNFEIIA